MLQIHRDKPVTFPVIPASARRTPLTSGQKTAGLITAAVVTGGVAAEVGRQFHSNQWSAAYGVTVLALSGLVGGLLGFGVGSEGARGVDWLTQH
jgi:peptidoglycan/LPS O-acetylase OafA/YrhL